MNKIEKKIIQVDRTKIDDKVKKIVKPNRKAKRAMKKIGISHRESSWQKAGYFYAPYMPLISMKPITKRQLRFNRLIRFIRHPFTSKRHKLIYYKDGERIK